MPNLKVLKPRLSKLAPRLSTARAIRDTRYSPDATVRGWYHSARWQKLRLQVLERDLYTCRHTGQILAGKAPALNSAVVHHKVPHKGDERLFWDINNLEAVSKEWHDSEAQRTEKQAY
ncbi:HNH endonuclease [Devosia beringensis]|uniref:HNH endonuclease n=1 Tax=Devosia beringensis TaxID=2657486 RepID=UPI00186B5986|nr:HNH endonuclease [Devosia beringensis]